MSPTKSIFIVIGLMTLGWCFVGGLRLVMICLWFVVIARCFPVRLMMIRIVMMMVISVVMIISVIVVICIVVIISVEMRVSIVITISSFVAVTIMMVVMDPSI